MKAVPALQLESNKETRNSPTSTHSHGLDDIMAAAPEAPADEGNTSGADALTLEEADEKAQGNNAADSKKLPLDFEAEWEKDESNPMNWPTWRKAALVFCISSMGFIA